MLAKLALLLSIVALAASFAPHNPLLPPDRGEEDPEFIYRCPLSPMGGIRHISFDHKLFTVCNRAKKGTDGKGKNVEQAYGELDLGRCFANDNGTVRYRKNGNLQQTCSTCEIDGDTSVMVCSCPNKNDEWIESKTELNALLNVDKEGKVCCKKLDVCGKEFDANEYHVPPPRRRRGERGGYNGTEVGGGDGRGGVDVGRIVT